MVLVFKNKSVTYHETGEVKGCRVVLTDEFESEIRVELAPEKVQLTNSELFELAYEEHYQRSYLNRAENEKFNSIDEKIKKYDELLQKSQKAIEELEEATEEAKAAAEENKLLIKTATLAMNDALSQVDELIEKLEEKEDETIRTIETTDNGGTADE